MFVYMCVCTNACHSAWVEVRGQFAGVGSLVHSAGPRGGTQVIWHLLSTEPSYWPLKPLQGFLIDLFKPLIKHSFQQAHLVFSTHKEYGGLGRTSWGLGFQLPWGLVSRLTRGESSSKVPTSRLEMSMSTAQLVEWLHWQVTWVRFLDSSSQPLADHPPVPPMLWRREEWVSLSHLPLR